MGRRLSRPYGTCGGEAQQSRHWSARLLSSGPQRNALPADRGTRCFLYPTVPNPIARVCDAPNITDCQSASLRVRLTLLWHKSLAGGHPARVGALRRSAQMSAAARRTHVVVAGISNSGHR